ncbi:hypothetical protein [Acinetobacter colistiniresistens]|uniref:hypothetical protein n=1 Tax=Acinetobacter colistiniresistens TaxID=280145 RepID=UPI001250CEFA|nr:hypothetical protein [Acinetobacter colistiniresistens]
MLAALHGENYYVYAAEQAVRPKFDLSNVYLQSLFTSYSYFILGVLTICVMLIACITGIFYRMPDYDQNMISKMPIAVRALLSIFGGIMSMIYLIHTDGDISFKTVAVVGFCSYITPATFHLIHAACVKAVSITTNIFIKRFVYLFTGEVIENVNEKQDKTDSAGDHQDEP